MISSNNINIASRSVLSSPGAVRSELPLSLDAVVKVMEARREICDILDGKCDEIPEQCFRLKGGIDDVYAAYEEMKKEEA